MTSGLNLYFFIADFKAPHEHGRTLKDRAEDLGYAKMKMMQTMTMTTIRTRATMTTITTMTIITTMKDCLDLE